MELPRDKRFSGQTAIVTGGSRGIGFAIAERLVAEGARVTITGRKVDTLTEAVESLGGPDCALGVAGRADDPEHQQDVVEKTMAAFGSLHLLVNNAGINPVYGRMLDLDAAAARKIFEVNDLAAVTWTQRVHGQMGECGAILNISSVAGLSTAPNIGFYGASKAMLMHITRELAVELAPRVRVNALAPAVVKTRFASALYEDREQEVADRYPMKRLGRPDDTAAAACFLLSQEAGWITGHTLILDGGGTLLGARS